MTNPSEQALKAANRKNFIRLLGYTKLYRSGFIAAIIGMILAAGADTLFVHQLQPLIDDGLTNENPNILKYAPLFVICIFTFRGVCNFIGDYCLSWVGNNVVMSLRQELFEHIMRMPVAFHDKESTGGLISKVTYDTEQVLEASSKALSVLVKEGAFVLGLLGMMFYHSWQLSSVFLVITPIIAILVALVSKRFRKISTQIQQAMGSVTTATEQSFNGHKVVLTFGGLTRENKRFAGINNRNRQQRMKLVAAKAISTPVIQIIASFALATVLYISSLDAMDNISPGTFTSVVTGMMLLLRPLKQLTNVNGEFQKGMAACKTIFEVLDSPCEEDSGTKTFNGQRAQGKIEFDQVEFAYPNAESTALNKLSFAIEPGKTLALVGRSGSGKSTVSALMLRFYRATNGAVKVDGENINDYTLDSLRPQFAYVSQQVVLFNDTLSNNIAYGRPDATPEQIEEAAKAAHVLEFADRLPERLDTLIGENGAMLSGGQRQRIAIARAILCDAPILILDEATSALDTESERHIQEALNLLQKNRTCLVIAHRLSTIESADSIAVMEQGQIIEQGDHKTLLEQDGAYAQLHKIQFSG